MFSLKEKITRRSKLIKEHHDKATGLLNGDKEQRAQKEMIAADEQQSEMFMEYVDWATQPFYHKWCKKEKAAVGFIIFVIIFADEIFASEFLSSLASKLF